MLNIKILDIRYLAKISDNGEKLHSFKRYGNLSTFYGVGRFSLECS